jgi:uncharacterized damage-inducible protein DinB
MPQTSPPGAADELTQLTAFLDNQRDIIRCKTAGLDGNQLAAILPPSQMTLGGMLKHLAYVEDWWLGERLAGDPPAPPWDSAPWEQDEDWDWHSADGEAPEELQALYEASVQRADAVLEGRSPDDLAATTMRDGGAMNVRFVLLHLIEEYARHAGHADLLRESIDGSTGR